MLQVQRLNDCQFTVVRDSGRPGTAPDVRVVEFSDFPSAIQVALTELRAGVTAEFGEYRSDEDLYILSETWFDHLPARADAR